MKTMIQMMLVMIAMIVMASTNVEEKFGSLTVKVSGIRSNQGNVMIAVGDYQAAPDKVLGRLLPSDTMGVTFVFDKVPAGTHKVYLFHDENMNYKLDMDEKHIPMEGYGILPDANPQTDYETRVSVDDKPVSKSLMMHYLTIK